MPRWLVHPGFLPPDDHFFDDVRLAVGLDWPGLDVKDAAHASIYAGQTLTFTNAGNRSMAVTSAELMLGLPAEHLEGQCRGSSRIFPSALPLMIDGFVIKPGEIIVREIRLNPVQPFARSENGSVVVDLETKSDQGVVKFNACLQLNMLTPDNDQRLVEIPLAAFQYKSDFHGVTRGRAISVPRTPVPLWTPRPY